MVKFIFGFTDLFCPDEIPERGRKASAFFIYVSFVVLISMWLKKL